jgi:UDP-glucose 4-epimerase
VHMVETNLGNQEQLEEVIGGVRPHWIFHLAAYGAYSFQNDFSTMVGTNITGTSNLVHACLKHGFESFINAGSSSEYGYKDHPPSENEEVMPNSYYAVTKASATLFCGHMARKYGARIRTLRLYSVYGPWEEPARLVPNLLTKGLAGGWPPLVDGSTARDYVYADDVCEAFVAAAQSQTARSDGIYNIGTGTQTTVSEIVAAVRQILDVDPQPEFGTMSARAWDTNVWVSDPANAMRDLGWKAKHSLHDGIMKTASWFNNNPEILRHYREEQTAST